MLEQSNWKIVILLTMIQAPLLAQGRVNGVVHDEKGAALAKARVSLHVRAYSPKRTAAELAALPAGFTPGFNARMPAASGGAFAFSGVPTDSLVQVCVQTDDPLVVDSCHWDARANRFLLASGGDLQNLMLTAKRGHMLTVLVEDPQGLLGSRNWAQPKSALTEEVLASIRTPVLGFVPLPPQQAPGGRLFQYLIPFDTPMPLNLHAPGLFLKDKKTGLAMKRFSQVVMVRQGETPPNLSFTVTRSGS